MLTLQSPSATKARQGRRSVVAELQAGAAASAIPTGIRRQRLLDMAQRLARVQALGGEYARVGFSPQVQMVMDSLKA